MEEITRTLLYWVLVCSCTVSLELKFLPNSWREMSAQTCVNKVGALQVFYGIKPNPVLVNEYKPGQGKMVRKSKSFVSKGGLSNVAESSSQTQGQLEGARKKIGRRKVLPFLRPNFFPGCKIRCNRLATRSLRATFS